MNEDKKQSLASIDILNQNGNRIKFRINIVEIMPRWKTVYMKKLALGEMTISEGFKTWKEVRIFLSGMRAFSNFGR